MFRKLSIKTTLTFLFILIFAILMVMLYCLNSFFLNDYYQAQKMKQIAVAYVLIDEAVAGAGEDSEDIFELIRNEKNKTSDDSPTISIFRNLNEKSNIDVVLMNKERTKTAATGREANWQALKLNTYINYLNNEFMLPESSAYENGGEENIGDSAPAYINGLLPDGIYEINEQVRVLEQNENYTTQLVVDARSNTSHIECIGVFSDNDTYFLMTTPIESIEEGVKVTTTFLMMTGIIIIVLGSVVVYVAVSRFTDPINKLAVLSGKIANLDFSERYEGRQHNEIGQLGNSMNLMSDKLETSIRELSEANKKLQADIEEKIKADEARKEFIANVSHELKTPIALIEGYAEGLVEGLADEKESRDYYCHVIIDESVKMNKMVRQLTSLISYEFGSNTMELNEFDICDLIKSVTDAMKLKFEEKETVLIMELPECCMVMADEFKIEEVYTNYVNNALNHLSGERNIKIKVVASEEETAVYVYNDGDNIPEESLDRVWEKFYKVDKARTRAYGGSGIGLSIVKAIMESHGGRYGVSNREHGVEFYFTLINRKP